jgi:hypothetical protein
MLFQIRNTVPLCSSVNSVLRLSPGFSGPYWVSAALGEVDMANVLLEPSFRHRENLDGSWDSICLRCYATAAHSYGEGLLAEAEQGHCCDEARWFFRQPLPLRRHDGRPAYLREAEPVARRG